MAKVVTLRCKVTELNVSRTQYKPYSYMMVPENLFVEITVPADGVIDNKDGTLVVSMDGFSATLGVIADSLDSMHKQWESKDTGLRRR
jgi:hypothetical protein